MDHPSVLFYQTAQCDHVVDIDRGYRSHQLPLCQLGILKGNAPRLPVPKVLQGPIDHVQSQSYHVPRLQLGPIFGPSRVATVPGLAVVDSPTMNGIRECFLQIKRCGPTDSNLDELPFVDKKFEVVPAPSREDLSTSSSFEATTLLREAYETILIQFEFGTGLLRIPAEESCIGGESTCVETLRWVDHLLTILLYGHRSISIVITQIMNKQTFYQKVSKIKRTPNPTPTPHSSFLIQPQEDSTDHSLINF